MENQISAKFSAIEATLGPDPFMTVSNDGSEDGQCSLAGSVGNMFQDIMVKNWLKLGYNCTMEGFKNFGLVDDGSGMKGSIARWKSDISLFPSRIWESDQVRYTHPIYDEYLLPTCGYNHTDSFTSTDIIDAYLDLHWSFYVSLCLTLCCFICAWRICTKLAYRISDELRNEINNARLPSYWIMICAILDQDQFPTISRFVFTMLSFCFSLFFFITIDCFMLNILSTDLVVIDEPRVIRSYSDILARDNLKFVFMKGADEMSFFFGAKEGTVEHYILKRSIIADDLGPSVLGTYLDDGINQVLIGLVRDWTMMSIAILGINMVHGMGIKQFRVSVRYDETGKRFLNAFMVRENLPKILDEYVSNQVYKISQSGILTWFMKNRMPHMVGGSEMNTEEFISSKLFLATAPLPEIKQENFHKLFYIFSILLFIALIVLLYEIYKNRYQIKKLEQDHWKGIQRLRSRRRKGIFRKLVDTIFNRIIVV